MVLSALFTVTVSSLVCALNHPWNLASRRTLDCAKAFCTRSIKFALDCERPPSSVISRLMVPLNVFTSATYWGAGAGSRAFVSTTLASIELGDFEYLCCVSGRTTNLYPVSINKNDGCIVPWACDKVTSATIGLERLRVSVHVKGLRSMSLPSNSVQGETFRDLEGTVNRSQDSFDLYLSSRQIL